MKVFLLALSFLALSFPAVADSTSRKKGSSSAGASRPAPALDAAQELAFKKHDLDGDGEISKAEAAGSTLIGAFDRFDRNRDGKLDRAEYARAMAPKRQARADR